MKIIAYKIGSDIFRVTVASDARRQVVVTPARFEIQNGEVVGIEAETRDGTDDELIAWVAQRDIPAGVEFKFTDEMPAEDADLVEWFDGLGASAGTAIGRDAWDQENDALHVNQVEVLQAQYDQLAAQVAADKAEAARIAEEEAAAAEADVAAAAAIDQAAADPAPKKKKKGGA